MGEDDATGGGVGEDARSDDAGAGAFPVERVDGPEDGGVVEFGVDEFALALEEPAVRWAHGAGLDAGGACDGIAGAGHFLADFGIAEFGEEAVGVGVVADFVAFGDGAADDAGVEVDAAADDVEGGFDVACAEDVEEARGVLRVWAVVEGEGDVFSGDGDSGEGDAGAFGEVGAEVHVRVARDGALDGRGAVGAVGRGFDWVRRAGGVGGGECGFVLVRRKHGAAAQRCGGDQEAAAGEAGKVRLAIVRSGQGAGEKTVTKGVKMAFHAGDRRGRGRGRLPEMDPCVTPIFPG